MKPLFFVVCTFMMIAWSVPATAAFPTHLGGFVLGDDVSAYKDKVAMASCKTLRYMDYIEEGEVMNLPGFKSGLIAYGTCDRPNKILRIKLKYQDGSKGFFNKLKGRFERSFGAPDEYLGDPFQILIGWKWSFKDANGDRISLVLQHNSMNPEEKIGNAVKLSLTSQMDRERVCFESKQPAEDPPIIKTVTGQAMWRLFVPY